MNIQRGSCGGANCTRGVPILSPSDDIACIIIGPNPCLACGFVIFPNQLICGIIVVIGTFVAVLLNMYDITVIIIGEIVI